MKRKNSRIRHTYARITYDIAGVPMELTNVTIAEARHKIRKQLDKAGLFFTGITGYNSYGTAVYLSGVRSTSYKHFPVATATRG